MKTAVSIPDRVFRAAEKLARRLGLSRSRLYALAIESYLRAARREDVTEALNRVYPRESSKLDPVLARMQFSSLRREPW